MGARCRPTVPSSTGQGRSRIPRPTPRMRTVVAALTGVRMRCRPVSVDWPPLWRPREPQRRPGRPAPPRPTPRLSPPPWPHPRPLLRRPQRWRPGPWTPPVPQRHRHRWPCWSRWPGRNCWSESMPVREHCAPRRCPAEPPGRVIPHHPTVPVGVAADPDRPAVRGFPHRCSVGNWASECRRGSSGVDHGKWPASPPPARPAPSRAAWCVWRSSSVREAPDRRIPAAVPEIRTPRRR